MSLMQLDQTIIVLVVSATMVVAGTILSGCRPGFLGNSQNNAGLETSKSLEY